MDIKIVDTDSSLFKLYAAQLIRAEPREFWNVDDVLERETNVCDFGWRVFLQFVYRFIETALIVLAGAFGGLCVIVPLMTVLLWAVTDNGLIPFMGHGGVVVMLVEAVLIAFATIMGGAYGISCLWDKSTTLTPVSLAATWIENKRGKYCSRIEFKVNDDSA